MAWRELPRLPFEGGWVVSVAKTAAVSFLARLRKRSKAFALLAALALHSAGCRGRENWLRTHTTPIRTVDLAAADDSDLAKVGEAIGPARVVLLGEPNHTNASVLEAKSRLVRYLHEHLGFDLLAFEAGFFEMSETWREIAGGGAPLELAGKTLARVWLTPREGRPLLAYLAASSHASRPLVLAGIDPWFRGQLVNDHLEVELGEFLQRAGISQQGWQPFAEDLHRLVDLRFSANRAKTSASVSSPPVRDRGEFSAYVARLRSAVAPLGASGALAFEARYWDQVLANLEVWARLVWSATDAGRWDRADPMIRERQLANNVLWLAQRQYPNSKLIVWAATYHLIRNGTLIQANGKIAQDLRLGTMGDDVWKALGRQSYVVGFTGYESAARPSGDASTGTDLEALLGGTRIQYAFLDIRTPTPGGEWLQGVFQSRVLGFTELSAPWSKVLDGFFYTRELREIERQRRTQ